VCGDEWTPVDGQIAFAVDRRLRSPANRHTVPEPGARLLPITACKISRSQADHLCTDVGVPTAIQKTVPNKNIFAGGFRSGGFQVSSQRQTEMSA
jgi:hypothetical protein